MAQKSKEMITQSQNRPKDEFIITHEYILYNKEEDKLFCLLETTDKEGVRKHYEKLGITYERITDAKTTV